MNESVIEQGVVSKAVDTIPYQHGIDILIVVFFLWLVWLLFDWQVKRQTAKLQAKQAMKPVVNIEEDERPYSIESSEPAEEKAQSSPVKKVSDNIPIAPPETKNTGKRRGRPKQNPDA